MAFSTEAYFVCPLCKTSVNATVDVPDAVKEIETICPVCDDWITTEVKWDEGDVFMSFSHFPATKIICTLPYDVSGDGSEDYLDLIATPQDVFVATVSDGRKVLTEMGKSLYTHPINRMVFINHYAAFEAYLCDTLVNFVRNNHSALVSIITNNRDLKDIKLPMLQILAEKDVVRQQVTNKLKEVLYHNLEKVEVLYKLAAGIGIFPDAGVKARLMQTVQPRHDCVHRNGRDSKGDTREGITRDYVNLVARDMTAVVQNIESEIMAYSLRRKDL